MDFMVYLDRDQESTDGFSDRFEYLLVLNHSKNNRSSSPANRVQNLLDFSLNMSSFSLTGRTALVTGGARGCGLAFAQGLAEAGADVAVFDVGNPAPAFHEMEKQYGVKTKHYK